MKKMLLLLICSGISMINYAQQKKSITSTRENNYCNGTCTLIDISDLDGNPTAVLFIKHEETNGINLDPHTITAYYNGKQWSVMNTDNSVMPPGSKFTVEYFLKPDESHFTHVVTKENLVKDKSYIDHAGLNENPAAVFTLFQNAAPNTRGGYVNKDEISSGYDASVNKWYIINSSKKTLDLATGYNISITSATGSVQAPVNVANPVVLPANSLAPAATFTPGISHTHPSERVFMSVVGKIQGAFPGDNSTTRTEISSFEMESNSPRDLSSGLATGKRQHMPVVIQKETGTATTEFFKAFTTNEQLTTVTFEIYRPDIHGVYGLIYKIVLNNATVSNFKQFYTEEGKLFLDMLKFTFQSTEITVGGVTVTDTWPSAN